MLTLAASAPGGALTSAAAGAQGATLAPVDFDGDQKTDWAIVRQTGSGPTGQLTWFSLTQTGVVTVTPWGLAGDFVVPGDYDGDGKADIAVWRPGSPGTFYVKRSTDGTLLVQSFGELGDDPTVVGDYDGDGRTDFAIYRQGSTVGAQSHWFWRRSSDGDVASRAWGLRGDVPAPGDYDGDDVADFGVRRDVGGAGLFYLQQSTAGFQTVTFGLATDTVVPGDYDGDGKIDVAVTRQSGGQLNWFARRSSDGTTLGLTWGVDSDLSVQGDYDGDGRTDSAVWRPSADPAANRFWVLGTAAGTMVQQWGLQNDYPVANFNSHGSTAPAITSVAATTFTVGVAGAFTVTTSGFPHPSIVQGGALPSGVTFIDNGSGSATLAGTPAPGTSGTYALTLQATNAGGSSAVQNFTLSVHDAPSITSAASTVFIAGSPGTFTVTTAGLPAPALARGGAALPAGVTFVDNLDGTGTLAGTPAAVTGGVYALTFTASNSAGSSPAQSFSLTVNEAPAITSAAATTFAAGVAGTFTVTATGFPTPGLVAGGAALPAGVTFVDNLDGTGTLSGTPAAATGGTYAITFTAANTVGGTGPQAFTLSVTETATITSANATTLTVGAAGTFTVTTSGFPTGTSMVIGATGPLPTGVTFTDNTDGTATLSGTPAAATGGTYPLTITAANGIAPGASQNFTLTVNQAPVITSAASTTFAAGTPGTFTVTTTGFPTGASMAISRTGALPTGVTLVDNNDGTATLAGTPGASTGGTYPIAITANNAVTPNATQNFTLTVTQAPVITSAAATSFIVGAAGSFTVTTSGFPAPTIARGGVALPSGVTFVDSGNGTGTLAGTPGAATTGTYAITFTATNTFGSTPAQGFTLTVQELPVATDDSPGTIDANTSLSGLGSGVTNLLFNDTPGIPAATLVSFGGGLLGGTPASFAAGAMVNPLPAFGSGSLVVNANGSYTFVAPTGFTGAYTFLYRLTNAAGNSDATVTINVRPVANADTFAPIVIGNVAIDIASSVLAANDVVNPALTIAVVSGTTTAGGQVSAAAGVVTYDAPAGYEGADSFSYTVTDGGGTSAPAAVSLTVGGMIWFVNNTAGTNGDGRLSAPFNSLQNFVTVNDGVGSHPADGESIFLYESLTPYVVTAAPLVLRTGQRLIGQDHLASPLATLAGVTVPSGSTLPAMNQGPATVLASTVELRDQVQLHGLTISTGTSPGVTDPVAPTVATYVTDVIVETTTGIAVALSDVAGTFSFRSVSADGALHGIILTNASGSFAVTGNSNGYCGGNVNTGSDPYAVIEPDVADCTGGTIQNTTSNGIRLINATTIDLNRMRILNTVGSGIKGSDNIVNFFFANGFIDGSHDAVLDGANSIDESNIAFNDNVTGTETNISDQLTINRSTFRNGLYHALDIVNYGGALNMSITFNLYTSSPLPASALGSGVRLMTRGTATEAASIGRAIISNSVFTNYPGQTALEAIGGNMDPAGPPVTFGTPGALPLGQIVSLPNNRFVGNALDPMLHAVVAMFEGRGQGAFHIFGHGTAVQPVINVSGDVIVHTVRGDANVTSFVQNNYIVANQAVDAGDQVGIRVSVGEVAGIGDTAALSTIISGNTISQTDGSGILAIADEGSASLNARISNNTVAAPLGLGTAPGILVKSGKPGSIDNAVCLDSFGNTSAGENGGFGIGLRKEGAVSATNDFGVEGMAATASPDVEAFVAGLNPAGGGVTLPSASSGFSGCSSAPARAPAPAPAVTGAVTFLPLGSRHLSSPRAPRAARRPVF